MNPSKILQRFLPVARLCSVGAASAAETMNLLIITADDMNADSPSWMGTLQLAVLHDEFAKAITAKQPLKCNGGMGLRDVRLVEAVYASVAQGGRPVSVNA